MNSEYDSLTGLPVILLLLYLHDAIKSRKLFSKMRGKPWKSRNQAIPAHLRRYAPILACLGTGVHVRSPKLVRA